MGRVKRGTDGHWGAQRTVPIDGATPPRARGDHDVQARIVDGEGVCVCGGMRVVPV